MFNRATLAYLYDGSYDGLLTSIFETYARKQQPNDIAPEENFQPIFGQQIVRIITDETKAHRVEKGIIEKIGNQAFQNITIAFLSSDLNKSVKIYRYIREGLLQRKKIYANLTNEAVLAINKINKTTLNENHFFKEFLRFSKMDGDVYYAKIEPKNNVIPILMPHFVDRYSIQPFLIHDPIHKIIGIYNLKEWYMMETQNLQIPNFSEDEIQYRRMWKSFYDTIAIKERVSHKRRRTMMPMRYWKNMIELTLIDSNNDN